MLKPVRDGAHGCRRVFCGELCNAYRSTHALGEYVPPVTIFAEHGVRFPVAELTSLVRRRGTCLDEYTAFQPAFLRLSSFPFRPPFLATWQVLIHAVAFADLGIVYELVQCFVTDDGAPIFAAEPSFDGLRRPSLSDHDHDLLAKKWVVHLHMRTACFSSSPVQIFRPIGQVHAERDLGRIPFQLS